MTMQEWLLVRATKRWYDQQADYMAAAVAYYAPLAIIPLAYIVVTISGIVFEAAYIEAWLLEKGAALGPELATLIRDGVLTFATTTQGQAIPFISTIFFSAVVIVSFNTLIGGINQVCQVPHKGVRGWIEKCLRSAIFLGVLGAYISALLLVQQLFEFWEHIIAGFLAFVAFWVLTAILCMLAYTILTWHSLSLPGRMWGGIAASALLLTGQSVVSIYAASSQVPGLFTAAELIVVLLVWVYVIVCIVLFGAAVAYEYDVKNNDTSVC